MNLNKKFSKKKYCTLCKIELILDNNWTGERKSKNTYRCLNCHNRLGKEYYQKNKNKILKKCKEKYIHKVRKPKYGKREILLHLKLNGCAICGYNRSISGLMFHHTNPSDKKFDISRLSHYTNKQLKEELNKCVLLCANCHSEIHEL